MIVEVMIARELVLDWHSGQLDAAPPEANHAVRPTWTRNAQGRPRAGQTVTG
jgi:hypothetical protein